MSHIERNASAHQQHLDDQADWDAWMDEMELKLNTQLQDDFLRACAKPGRETLTHVEFNGVVAKRCEIPLRDCLDTLLLDEIVMNGLMRVLSTSSCMTVAVLKQQMAREYAKQHTDDLVDLLRDEQK